MAGIEIVLIALADIFSLLVVAVVLILARRNSLSVREITKSADALARGMWEGRVLVKTGGDVGELAKTFNLMAESLQQAFTDLAGEKDKLSAILSVMSEGVIMVEADDRISVVNPAAQQLTGIELMPGRILFEQFHNREFRQLLQECRSSSALQKGEIDIPGKLRLLEVTVTPLQSSSGSTSRILVVMHDISDIGKAERTRQ